MNKSKWHEENKGRVRAYQRVYLKEYRAKNREKLREVNRKWYAKNRDSQIDRNRTRYYEKRIWLLERKYGLVPGEFERMLADQDGRCAICRTDKPGGRFTMMHVDHCHTTGKVRGLLCNNCNPLLGRAKDSPAVLRAAAAYLERTLDIAAPVD